MVPSQPDEVRHTEAGHRLLELTETVLAQLVAVIGGQVLATRGQTGYVVTDSSSGLTTQLVEDLRAVPETIRLRVID